jgi:hypothetical protein
LIHPVGRDFDQVAINLFLKKARLFICIHLAQFIATDLAPRSCFSKLFYFGTAPPANLTAKGVQGKCANRTGEENFKLNKQIRGLAAS